MIRSDARPAQSPPVDRFPASLQLSQCCPLLERVLMPDSKGVGDRGLRGLSLQSPPRVHTLVLSPCLDVTAVGLRALTRLAPSLTHLSLSHTRLVAVVLILTCLPGGGDGGKSTVE